MARFILLSAFMIGAITSSVAHAEWQFSGGAGMRLVQMTETERDGRELVEEKGWLPGLELRAEYKSGDWRFGVSGETYRGDLNYDGETQSGVPFLTDTGTRFSRIGLDMARQITDATRLIGGVEWDHWRRNIQGRGTVAGINERITSWRLLAGGETRVLQTAWANVDARALLVLAAPERLRVRFSDGFIDEVRLKTKSAPGLRLGVGLQPAALPAMTVSADVDWIRIRRSDDAEVRMAGAPVGVAAQPEHTRKAFGVRVSYRF